MITTIIGVIGKSVFTAICILLVLMTYQKPKRKRIVIIALCVLAAGLGAVAFDTPSLERLPLVLIAILMFGLAILCLYRWR